MEAKSQWQNPEAAHASLRSLAEDPKQSKDLEAEEFSTVGEKVFTCCREAREQNAGLKDLLGIQVGYHKALIEMAFINHAPTPEDVACYHAIRDAGKILADVILTNTPKCADQSDAVMKVREAVMTANVAIATRGAM